jgi:hypothetical protein
VANRALSISDNVIYQLYKENDMTPEQRAAIENAWAKKRITYERIKRASELCLAGGLTHLPADEMEKRYAEQAQAIRDDGAALEVVAEAMRAVGLQVE